MADRPGTGSPDEVLRNPQPEVARFCSYFSAREPARSGSPDVERSADPADNFLLAMAEAGNANYLVSGDRRGVLALGTHGITQIIRAREFLGVLGIKPIGRSVGPIQKRATLISASCNGR